MMAWYYQLRALSQVSKMATVPQNYAWPPNYSEIVEAV
jgi:hypothetical protein